ncbi:hypothetical protein BJ742DRAFT_778680 [Cladochytrium replicatum]|nr:hypothetical protein BJ742DRAFT_778680 [Cladochytrium replicatum]
MSFTFTIAPSTLSQLSSPKLIQRRAVGSARKHPRQVENHSRDAHKGNYQPAPTHSEHDGHGGNGQHGTPRNVGEEYKSPGSGQHTGPGQPQQIPDSGYNHLQSPSAGLDGHGSNGQFVQQPNSYGIDGHGGQVVQNVGRTEGNRLAIRFKEVLTGTPRMHTWTPEATESACNLAHIWVGRLFNQRS